MCADNRLCIDCHVHTVYSGHGQGTVKDQVEAAIDKGLSVVAFTEHLTLPPGHDPQWLDSMSPKEAACYYEEILEQRNLHPEIQIVYGAEADWLGNEDYLLEATQGFDYVLGSVHFIDGWGFDNPDNMDLWDRQDALQVWKRYVELWLQACSSSVPFTGMAHPDLPKIFCRIPASVREISYEEMAQCAAKHGRIVEVNTAGFQKPIKEQYPSLELLAACAKAGVACSIGSDAHSPRFLGYELARGFDIMRAAGYSQVAVPCVGGGLEYRLL